MSDEPRQTKDWTGEEKLRAVLEGMKTSVAQICAKYAKHGISEEQVQGWRQLFVKRGGEIFEPKEESFPPIALGPGSRKRNPFMTFVATFSILLNCGLAGLAAAIYFNLLEVPDWFGGAGTNKVTSSSPGRSHDASMNQVNRLLADLDDSSPRPSSPRPPVTAPMFGGPPPVLDPGIVSEVEVCGIQGRGNKIVFVLDLNEYMRKAPGGEVRFERLRTELRDAVLSLRENTSFNVILLHGISRLHLFENKLAKATESNKRAASSWLSFPAWNLPNGVKPRFGEPDLLLQLPEGVVGPWRALSAALSFDPEIIYLLTGDCSSLRPEDFTAFELAGVELAKTTPSPVWDRAHREVSAIRLTVAKWLASDSLRAADLGVSETEVDNTIRQLGIAMPVMPEGSPVSRWPWKTMYTNFKGSLMRAIPDLASTHVVLSLPEGHDLPTELDIASRDFVQLTGGSYTILDSAFFSSP